MTYNRAQHVSERAYARKLLEMINSLDAKGSCGEVRSQIIRATDVGFIDKDTAKKLYNDSLNLSKAISKFITSLKGSSITGIKHLET